MLAFADAIGTTKPVLQACVSQLDTLKLHAQLGERQVQLATDGRYHYFSPAQPMQIAVATSSGTPVYMHAAANKEEKRGFVKQVQQQTEQLLFMAYKLQLAPLADRLHAFVCSHTVMHHKCSIIPRSNIGEVFTSRVLDAALGLNQLGKEAWISSALSEGCGLAAGSGKQQLFEPIGLTEQQKQPIEFDARLLRDFMGVAKGSIVPVKVRLFEDKIDIASFRGVKAQLAWNGNSGSQ